ncbi:zinc dependent phospholipase C family protein [Mucilaginibacter robiniae]|uniref:Zinc dependent phospholipase C family protein n=1 Tax=Mucilaginibacter robiniae TaxID=2728022 RepID=A0A7L5DWZ3_9SPHI|nr:zinc dependent phospholipase C family protein [Mucilaginibacter robiniae]QJD94607.1 zinc dependent phospholipase C family protein [Mucilaginibacter robiniae]
MPLSSRAFSILTHEAIIDAEWDNVLKPMLKQKYPDATDEDIRKAHSYAYGGSLVADIGYIPGGDAYFTDLLHYVRTGDFITNVLHEAQNLNEYAFALGTLSHYVADQYGHSLATNVTVPEVYPVLKKKFGKIVTYDEDHVSHSRMEFAYDAVQIGRSHYASAAYHDFIGFNIARPVLERAFLKTYGQDLNEVFKNFDTAIGRLRWGVKDLFPELTKRAWKANKKEIKKEDARSSLHRFKYRMSRRMYKQDFGKIDNKPDFLARTVGFIVSILPKIGPLKTLKFVYPGRDGEKRFMQTFDTIVVKYTAMLRQVDNNQYAVSDINLDTGHATTSGDYGLADETYSKLVLNLQKEGLQCMSAELQQNVLQYFSKVNLDKLLKDKPEKAEKLKAGLKLIKNAHPVPINQVSVTND